MKFARMLSACAALVSAAVLTGVSVQVSAQESWPVRPVKMVVSTAAGGSSDVVARIVAEGLATEIGQPVVVENRVGASGTIGAAFVARAPADGYTLFFGTGSTHVIAPAMMKGTPYDPVKDFTPLAIVGPAPFVLFVRASLPARNMGELAALARSKPGQLSIGTTGPAAVYELAALTLEAQANIRLTHVPYKGFAPMVLDVAAGNVDIGVGPIDGSLKTDRLRVLAVVGNQRATAMPEMSTSAEQGFPGFTIPAWAGLWTTAGTPQPVVDKLAAGIRTVMSRKDIQDRINQAGIVPVVRDGAALRKLMSDELDSVRLMMRNAKVEPQ